MLSNFHTHTVFCDGENTPEEIVLYALDRGFRSIGFSGHGNTPFDLRYCMQDTAGYIEAVKELKEKYKNKIQIYLGVEEDVFAPVNREDFDYIIGSSHYFHINERFYPIDSSCDYFKACLEVFHDDVLALAETYYRTLCDYISKRKPDVVGHFDLITKYDETDVQRFLNNEQYLKLAQKYMSEAVKNDVIFEINTGAVARGYRTFPYPCAELLHVIKKQGGKVMLASDSHSTKTLDYYFEEAKNILRDVGFDGVYVLDDGVFKKQFI